MVVSLSAPILRAHITELTKEIMGLNINGNRSAIEGTIFLKSKTSTLCHIMTASSSPTYIYNITISLHLYYYCYHQQLPSYPQTCWMVINDKHNPLYQTQSTKNVKLIASGHSFKQIVWMINSYFSFWTNFSITSL